MKNMNKSEAIKIQAEATLSVTSPIILLAQTAVNPAHNQEEGTKAFHSDDVILSGKVTFYEHVVWGILWPYFGDTHYSSSFLPVIGPNIFNFTYNKTEALKYLIFIYEISQVKETIISYLSQIFSQFRDSVLAAAAAKSLQSCLTLCDPIDGSPPGFPVPGILQARTLEWVAISFSNA